MQIKLKNKVIKYMHENYIHKQDLLDFINVVACEIRNKTNKPIRTFKPKYRRFLTIGDILMGVNQHFTKEA